MKRFIPLASIWLSLASVATARAAEPKPVPRMQAVPEAHDEISFQRDGVEIARYHYRADQKRPFVFPIIGPSGRSLTRIGHPHDPETHSHHNSVWISHQNVNGANFWEDRGTARIAHQRVRRIEDGAEVAWIETENAWLGADGKPAMREFRRTGVRALVGKEWMLFIDLQLEPHGAGDVTLGQTAFGLLGVRMAKTIGVHDGGGTIRNSEGGIDEAGCFRKPARWCDYSGPITNEQSEGITLMDHPMNLSHPVPFHVRNDGWMGAAPTFPKAHVIKAGERLRLRYGLYVHSGIPSVTEIEARWKEFAKTTFEEFAQAK